MRSPLFRLCLIVGMCVSATFVQQAENKSATHQNKGIKVAGARPGSSYTLVIAIEIGPSTS